MLSHNTKFKYKEQCSIAQQRITLHEPTHLVRVTVEVKVLQEASGKLTEQCVVGLVDGPQAPVGVVVGAGARTESTHWTTRWFIVVSPIITIKYYAAI